MSDEVDAFLAHHGVKGMHWGVHKARSDASEYAKAKLAYGEGAGTRRKLIKAKVEERSKNPQYKEAFDRFLSEQNTDRLSRQARVNHRTKSTFKSTTKTVRGVHRQLTGGFGSVTVTSAAIAGAYIYARKSGLDQVLIKRVGQAVSNPHSQAAVKDWLKTQGVG
jgi:hypothetical protein